MEAETLLEEDLLDPATRLLLAWLRLDGQERLVELAGTASVDEWQAAVQRAGELGVGTLLYARLSEGEIAGRLPGEVLARVEGIFQEGVFNNLQALRSLDKVLAALAKAQVAVIPLKGVYLGEKIYGRIGLRSMGDIDLLIPSERLGEAVQVLAEVGYQAAFSFQVSDEIQQGHALPALANGSDLEIDLHWNLVSPTAPFRISIEEIWRSSISERLRGFEIQAMSREDMLLHLCLHAAYLDAFSTGLRPICDIGWVIQAYQRNLDWTALVERAKEWGIGRSVWLGLTTAERLLHAPIPVGALGGLQPAPEDLAMLEWAIAQVLRPAGMSRKLAGVWAPNPWPKRVGLIVRYLFPRRHEMRPFYPRLGRGLLWPIAYGLHLAKVVRRNWGSAGKLIGADAQARGAAEHSDRVNRLLSWQEMSDNLTMTP